MNIVLFGASGKVGRLVAKRLLEQGHEITALVYGNNPNLKSGNLKIIRGDVHNIDAVREAMYGNNVVISTLGSWGTSTKDILSSATKNIIEVSKEHRINRFISLTGADARATDDKNGLINTISRPVLKITAGKILVDGEKHIAMLEQSKLNWTVIRSPIMTNGKKSFYKLSTKRPLPWTTISRNAVVESIIDQITSEAWSRKSPFIKSAR